MPQFCILIYANYTILATQRGAIAQWPPLNTSLVPVMAFWPSGRRKRLILPKWQYLRPVLKLFGKRVSPSRVSVPPSRFSVPPSRFRCPLSRFKRWMIRRKRPNSSPNFGQKPLQFPAKTFFWSSRNFGEKTLQISKEDFIFLVFIQFQRRNYAIFTKVLSHAKCVWSRLQKRPPTQNFTI